MFITYLNIHPIKAMSCQYSVVIRTLGNAGAKYQMLLDSIKSQTIPPSEIIVALPEGYDPPIERIGNERFVYGEKGMVRQRHAGIEAASSAFMLLCDDDISFPSDFVEQCCLRLLSHEADAVIPARPEDYDTSHGAKAMFRNTLLRMYLMFTGQVFPAVFQRTFRYAVAPTGGIIALYSIDRHKTYLAQSGAGGCLFMKGKTAKAIRFQEEAWLDDAAYALPEDHVFLYKSYLGGNKLLYTPDIEYEHLDASSSMEGSIHTARRAKWLYATSRNYTIFWNRFLFFPATSSLYRLFLFLCLMFRMTSMTVFFFLSGILSRAGRECFKSLLMGYRDAFILIKQPYYKHLPKITKHV